MKYADADQNVAPYVCPTCGADLLSIDEVTTIDFERLMGQRLNRSDLLDRQSTSIDLSLWSTLRLMAENISLLRRVAAEREEQARLRLEQVMHLQQRLSLLRGLLPVKVS